MPSQEKRSRAVDLEDREKQPASPAETDEIERGILRKFFDTFPLLAYSVTPDGRIRLCNEAALTFLGYDDPEELLGKPLVSTVYAPSSRRKAGELVDKWRRDGRLRLDTLTGCSRRTSSPARRSRR